jgi:hypothetical protein
MMLDCVLLKDIMNVPREEFTCFIDIFVMHPFYLNPRYGLDDWFILKHN